MSPRWRGVDVGLEGVGLEADKAVAVLDGAGGQGLHAPRADDELERGEPVDGRGRPVETDEVELHLGDDGPSRVDKVGGRRDFFLGLPRGADGVLEFVAQRGVGGGLFLEFGAETGQGGIGPAQSVAQLRELGP
ncbi:hypothetical protein ABZX90_38450 [Streptomyces sp. NPDC002935]|uniref:hypothetical protein n=1 Tax=Streptomyces sp. NPDC002935 TaxID=3154545 RepID=UPI0033B0C4C3